MDWSVGSQLRPAVEAALDRLRPALIVDGGNVELIDIDDEGNVRIAFQGACATCPAQIATLRIGLEAPLKRAVPGVTALISV